MSHKPFTKHAITQTWKQAPLSFLRLYCVNNNMDYIKMKNKIEIPSRTGNKKNCQGMGLTILHAHKFLVQLLIQSYQGKSHNLWKDIFNMHDNPQSKVIWPPKTIK
jgi:hypothetical protein